MWCQCGNNCIQASLILSLFSVLQGFFSLKFCGPSPRSVSAIFTQQYVFTSCLFHILANFQNISPSTSNNQQGDNIQPWRTPFPVWNQSVVLCPVLTDASWPAYRFLKRQVRWLVFPSPSEFSTVYCDPHSQRLWHNQYSRNRCFSGILAFWWSIGCWQFDLWFLCLF